VSSGTKSRPHATRPPVRERLAVALGGGRAAYPLLCIAIIVALVAVILVDVRDGHSASALPVDFRITQTRLSGLPVQIWDVESCSCWSGPRNQAQRKYKFRVLNQTSELINIGGGVRSAIRLIVAYPRSVTPHVTLPKPEHSDKFAEFQTPAGKDTEVASHVETVRPSEIHESNALLAVPRMYRVWALPPAPNEVAEEVTEGIGTFPTEVGKEWLLPGEAYSDTKVGYGDWTFYIPIKRQFQEILEEQPKPVLTPADYESEVIFVGIGVFRFIGGEVKLLGFAPAPSENALLEDSEL
jgi:hypothetical protein